MDIDFAHLTEHQRYKVMAGLIVPRPIALVTTLGSDGTVNAAPFSMFPTTWRMRLEHYLPVARFGASFYMRTRERFAIEDIATAPGTAVTPMDPV